MRNNFEKIKKVFLWLLFTDKCRYCNEPIDYGEEMCAECHNNLPVVKGEKCKYCGAEKKRCNCKKHKREYDGITAPFYYEDSIALSVRRLKFNGKDFLANCLSEEMAKCVKEDFGDIKFDFICFVPFTLSQKLHRRYNQSELLAEQLSEKLNIPLNKVMTKFFDTKPQHKTSFSYRAGNVFGVYDIKEDADVKGKTILLVDDVKTTGSTLNDCARILKIRGAESVYCTVVALAGVKEKEKKTETD